MSQTDLLGVRVERGGHDLEQLGGHAGNLMLVRASLDHGEHLRT